MHFALSGAGDIPLNGSTAKIVAGQRIVGFPKCMHGRGLHARQTFYLASNLQPRDIALRKRGLREAQRGVSPYWDPLGLNNLHDAERRESGIPAPAFVLGWQESLT